MVLELRVRKDLDGFTGKVASVKGCEAWAETEDAAIEKTVELLRFFLNIPEQDAISEDKARNEECETVYKLIFTKGRA